MNNAPKELWVNVDPDGNTEYVFPRRVTAVQRSPLCCTTVRYIIAPEHRALKREVIAYVVKRGNDYLYELPNAWTADLSLAIRYAPWDESGARWRARNIDSVRVVRLVRKATP